MATEFKNIFIKVPAFLPEKNSGAVGLLGEVEFDYPVIKAETALNGFNINFGKKEKLLDCIQLDSDVETIVDKTVKVKVNLIFTNGSLKSSVEGWVSVLVIAKVKS